ncbi:MAG: general secretion pathway protein GspI [Bdellovibrionales bacterium]|nr:general secretion pathway protein GspI [Bdellovibrionales bacterium]
MSILTMVIVAVSSTWSGNFNRVRKINFANNVSTLLERKMVELETKYKGKPVAEIPEEEAGDFGADYPQYRWALTSQEFQMPDLTALLTSQEGGADEMLITMIKQVNEFVSKAVKEVTLTVFVKASQKEVPYKITTYFVDWEQDLGLPGGAGGGTTGGGGSGSGSGDAGGGTGK